MALSPRTRVGSYEITSARGAGGMGDDYRAHDARGCDVPPDGQRFVLLQARELAPDVIRELIVVQNWTAALR